MSEDRAKFKKTEKKEKTEKKTQLFTGKAEKVESAEKPKRARRNKIDAICESIKKKFKFVPQSVMEEQIGIIKTALLIISAKNKKLKFTEEDIIEFFTEEQIQKLLLKKQGKMEIH